MKSQTYAPLIDQLLRPMGLLPVYEYVAAHNPANDLPYHNLFHTQCMVLTCQKAAKVADLPVLERQALVVAPLFHDYAHSGGTRADAENIAVAKAALEVAAPELGLAADLVSRSLELVEATQYPHIRPACDESERIIQDADMCQMLYGHWFEQVYMGLRAEMAHTRGAMTLSEFCAMQRSFFPAIELHSAFGRNTQKLLQQTAMFKCAMAERAAVLMAEHGLSELDAYARVKADLAHRTAHAAIAAHIVAA
jgi:predicted metal-dependent HD superfamily phosphohydrolase